MLALVVKNISQELLAYETTLLPLVSIEMRIFLEIG